MRAREIGRRRLARADRRACRSGRNSHDSGDSVRLLVVVRSLLLDTERRTRGAVSGTGERVEGLSANRWRAGVGVHPPEAKDFDACVAKPVFSQLFFVKHIGIGARVFESTIELASRVHFIPKEVEPCDESGIVIDLNLLQWRRET